MRPTTIVTFSICMMAQALTAPHIRAADIELPPASTAKIDFAAHIQPLLNRSCAKCHSGENRKGGFSIDTRESLVKGGEHGPAVVVGDSAESMLIELVADPDPELRMPSKGDALTPQQIGLLRAWIDQGVNWPEGFSFAKKAEVVLAPRKVELPPADAASGIINPIDRLLAAHYRENKVSPRELVSDRVFARRAHLDLVGLLPPPEVIDAFEADTRPDKRARLVDELLANDEQYATHWLTFWADALRNAYRGTGFIDGGRKQTTKWLYGSLYANKPYDRFVYELVSGTEGAEGFTYGIKWRGVVNDSQRREMQAAQTVSQVFMGVNLKCASCHDSFINDWKLSEAYALAAVFADGPLELHRCDKPTGRFAKPSFSYPQLGTIDADAPRKQRVEQLAAIMTGADNGRLTRTIVNRLWAQLLGRGIIEPLDDMDQQPWNADLLDWLAEDLRTNGYDIRHTLRLICTSRAYQLPSVPAPKPDQADFVFAGPVVKRMSAEQFVDAVSTLTGQWQRVTGDMLKPDGRSQGGQLAAVRAAIAEAEQRSADDAAQADAAKPDGAAGRSPAPVKGQWIWSHADAAKADAGGRIFLRRVITLDTRPAKAFAVATCDNEFILYVNGVRVAASDVWNQPATVDITKHLREGVNVFAAEATNWPDAETGRGANVSGANPAGFYFAAAGFDGDGATEGDGASGGGPAWSIGSDAQWVWRKGVDEGWQTVQYDVKDRGWKHAAVVAPFGGGPWGNGDALALRGTQTNASSTADTSQSGVRAALAEADALMRAMGRPNREQVTTRRESVATTLQALELTNGGTLDEMLKAGASQWVQREKRTDALVRRVYETALGRAPNAQELAIARGLVGEEPTHEGVQDLLWVLTMLPEFQLIY